MCGIAGFIGADLRLDEGMLRRMLGAHRHRGPDDEGVMFKVVGGIRVGMAHNRLSIQDLSAAGHQPMSDEGSRCWICYNGEFYNSPGYRDELKAKGEMFRSTSDTEVLLKLCVREGVEKALVKVNGMFAFGFCDTAAGELTICRDRAGQKPLFYIKLEDGSLVYASEIPALLATGLVDKEAIDRQAFDHYWTLGYTTGEHTFYRDIRRLRPGSMMTWREGKTEIKKYWSVSFAAEDTGKTMGQYVDELIPLLEDAVKLRLLSDVPVGICLSGGIDSALMAVMISRLRADVPAFTIAFEGTPEDEAVHAAAVAKHLGIEHRVLNVAGDLGSEFGKIAGWYGEPFGDASSIPMYFLSRMIREHATVALTGDGGDELFGGYHHYREGVRIFGGGSTFNIQHSTSNVQGWKSLARDVYYRSMDPAMAHARRGSKVNRRLAKRIYAEAVYGAVDHKATLVARAGGEGARGGRRGVLEAMQDADFHTYMTDDVHVKVDRMSMAHALECRSPFMDYRVIEWAARLPARVKLGADGRGKLVLREVLGSFMPRELFDRPKQGFTPPWERWCAGAVREGLREDWGKMGDGLVRSEAIERLVPEEGEVSAVLSWLAYSYVQWRVASCKLQVAS